MINRNKFLKLVSDEKTDTIQKNSYNIKNRDMLRISQDIALKILNKMDKENITKKELAEKLNISNAEVNIILRGKENLCLTTLINIQNKLDIHLLYNYKK